MAAVYNGFASSQDAFISYQGNNLGPSFAYLGVSTNYNNYALESVVSSTNKLYRFPIMTSITENSTMNSGDSLATYDIKVNKAITLSDKWATQFDIEGIWLDEAVIKDMFTNTPEYMKGFEEDVETPAKDVTEC